MNICSISKFDSNFKKINHLIWNLDKNKLVSSSFYQNKDALLYRLFHNLKDFNEHCYHSLFYFSINKVCFPVNNHKSMFVTYISCYKNQIHSLDHDEFLGKLSEIFRIRMIMHKTSNRNYNKTIQILVSQFIH